MILGSFREAILDSKSIFLLSIFQFPKNLGFRKQPDVRGMHPNLLDQHPLRYVSLER